MPANTNIQKNKAVLIEAGFNPRLLDKLLETKQGAKKLEVIVRVGLELMNNHEFNQEALVKIVSPRRGHNNLEGLHSFWPKLKEYGLTKEDAINIAS